MHVTAYSSLSDEHTTTVTLYRDGADPERVTTPSRDYSTIDEGDRAVQAVAKEVLAVRGLTVTSDWQTAPDPDNKPGSRRLVWRADVQALATSGSRPTPA